MKSFTFGLIILLMCTAHLALSEDEFNLFDEHRDKPPPPKTRPSPPPQNPFMRPNKPEPPPPPPPPLLPQKDFTLLGTSRIGNKRVAILQSPEGKQFIQRLNNQGHTPIEGYPDFVLLGIDARKIQLQYPDNAPCRASNAQKGLICSPDNKTATLSLILREAVAPPPPPKPPPNAVNLSERTADEARKQREEERQRRRELYKNFKRQVIKDEDVPPGMRVVRTPFGDRLVPDNK